MSKTEVICPKCKEEITELFWKRTLYHEGTLGIDKNGDEEFDEEFNIYDMQDCPHIYFCPNCNKELTRDNDKAIEFLKGNIKLSN